MRTRGNVLGFLMVAVVSGACGGGSHHSPSSDGAAPAGRTVDVEMRDIAYEPTTVSVRAGETVKFVFHNTGQIVHDAFLGDEAAQAAHEKEMRGGGSGDMNMHGGSDAIKVEPGKTGELTHAFKAGEALLFGCHEAGHYQAGMRLPVTVG
ncbi:MAG TPA: plastocyanin/azurin family copper-binding protein [Acidimicrobiia bacterium]|nr:plastocyanin/azurin family copper-binding protein [Acidimicrobiia bacterium]